MFPYQNSQLPAKDRILDLLSRMTVEEKVRQLNFTFSSISYVNKETGQWDDRKFMDFIGDAGIGSMQHIEKNKEVDAALCNHVQKLIMENTRLGIPILFVCESLHGFVSGDGTIFPQSIALASSFNRELMAQVSRAIGSEVSASGAKLTLAPDLDVVQDVRWGRTEETYGEDPYLVGEMSRTYVNGIQGNQENIDENHAGCTLKHFLAHGAPQGGINLAPVACGERHMREYFLPPFEKVLKSCRPVSVMPAYSELDGVPLHESTYALTDLLRTELGFDGAVISDYEGIEFLKRYHETADDFQEAGKLSLMAGVDIEAPRMVCFNEKFIQMVKEGHIPVTYVNRAVERVLYIKFRLGLFDRPFVDEEKCKRLVNCDAHRQLAREAAHETMVLLKNDNLLPLDKKKIKKLAVIGPNADKMQMGDYCFHKDSVLSPLQGLQEALGSNKVCYAKGCELTKLDTSGFEAAVKAAKVSDVALLILGGGSTIRSGMGWGYAEHPNPCTCGEGFDRTELSLPGVQQQLAEAVIATGKPTIVLIYSGRPQSITHIAQHANAILQGWYPGEEGARALADILFGDVNPSGKLPVTVPQSVGQLPMYYNFKPTARGRIYKQPGSPEKPGRDYVFMTPDPLYPFGFGLSYTTFAYSDLQVTPEVPLGNEAVVTVKVKNTGNRAGKESILLFVRDQCGSVTTPVKALKGFEKIFLKPGEEKTVTFALGFEALHLINQKMQKEVEKGLFKVMVGPLTASFNVI